MTVTAMLEIAEHILDIAENSVRAGASIIEISLTEEAENDRLIITIKDNGSGMNPAAKAQALDPFYTTKRERKRKFGLGLPLFAQMAQAAGGGVEITSQPGVGTTVSAVFGLSHIDRQPLGDVAGAFVAIILSNPLLDLTYIHQCGEKSFEISTYDIKKQIDETVLTNVAALAVLKEIIVDGIKTIGSQLL